MATRALKRQWRMNERTPDPLDVSAAYSEHFGGPRAAFQWLEKRGYRVTKQSNWLPPASLRAPSAMDLEASHLLGVAGYGGIVKLRACPFCGGKPDPFSEIGVECLDCGAAASDVAAWQRRV
jgi:hypothetical protein